MINYNGSDTLSWDENDPIESIFNDWTEEDFINAIRKDCFYSLQQSGDIIYWDPKVINETINKEDYDIQERLKEIAINESKGLTRKGNKLTQD